MIKAKAPNSDMIATFNRGVRFGQLIADIEKARYAIDAAASVAGRDLLTARDQKLLVDAVDILTGLEQRVWIQHQRCVAALKAK